MSEPSVGIENHCIDHASFGRIEIPDDVLIRCDGLPGFPDAQRLAILEHDRPSLFAWLICLERPDLSLAVTDPLHFQPDYAPVPHLNDLRAIGATPEDELDMLVVAKTTVEGTALNLAAPLLVNPKSRRAIQAILANERWPIWAPIRAAVNQEAAAQIESNPQR